MNFLGINVIATSTHYSANSVYTHEKERKEAINMDKIVKIFPATIKDYPNCTGILLDNYSVVFVDDTFDGFMWYISNISNMRRDDDYDTD